MEKTYCVYKHTAPNGVSYIGMTSNYRKRCGQHKCGSSSSKVFQEAIKEFGWDSIKHEILNDGMTYEEAYAMESQEILKAKLEGRAFNQDYGRPIKEDKLIPLTVRMSPEIIKILNAMPKKIRGKFIIDAVSKEFERRNSLSI